MRRHKRIFIKQNARVTLQLVMTYMYFSSLNQCFNISTTLLNVYVPDFISRAYKWTHYWSMITTTKRVGFELGSRAQKFRIITNRLAGQLITAKAFAIILKRN